MGPKTKELVSLTRVFVPGYPRVKNGKREMVDSYWRKGGVGEGIALLQARLHRQKQAAPGSRGATPSAPGNANAPSAPNTPNAPSAPDAPKPSRRLTPAQQVAATKFDSNPGYTKTEGFGKGTLYAHLRGDHTVPEGTTDSNQKRLVDFHVETHTNDRNAGSEDHAVEKGAGRGGPETPKAEEVAKEIKVSRNQMPETPKTQDLVEQMKQVDEKPDVHDGESAQNPIVTEDIETAVKALEDGKFVRLKSTRQVSSLVHRIKEIVDDAKAKGDEAPNYNLCQVSVPNTNLFCAENKGKRRIDMPQTKGKLRPGSPAQGLADKGLIQANEDGEFDLTDLFKQFLQDEGFGVKHGEVAPGLLKATQNELVGASVAKITAGMEKYGVDPARATVWTSNDDYIIDGHHRWAALATVGIDQADLKVPEERVDLDILSILKLTQAWTEEMGILPKAGSTKKTVNLAAVRVWVGEHTETIGGEVVTFSGHWVVRG